MAHREDQLAEAEGIGRMNVALHHLVVHQPVDDVGAFPLGRAEHGGVPQQVALVTEGVGGYALGACGFAVRFQGTGEAPLRADLLCEAHIDDVDRDHQLFEDRPAIRSARIGATLGWQTNAVRLT